MTSYVDVPANFRYILFEKTDADHNIDRFYYLAWQPTMLADGAIVRLYGHKGGRQRVLSPLPFASLDEARPVLQRLIRRRLRHGYRIVEF